MTYKKYLYLTCFLTTALSAPSSYAVPNSYAEIIAHEKQRMVDNNPHEQHQQSSPVINAAPNSYGDILSKEKQRMMNSHPENRYRHNNRLMKADSLSPLPTTWGGLIKNEHARMKQSLP